MISEKLKKFIPSIINHCETQFPKRCSCCQREFKSFEDFIKITRVVGRAPTDSGMSEEENPLGILSYVNCTCGSTLTIRCEDKTGEMHKMFSDAIEQEAKLSNTTQENVLAELRLLIRSTVTNIDE